VDDKTLRGESGAGEGVQFLVQHVKGTWIPVYVLLQKMAAGETEAELLKAYPQLSKADLMSIAVKS
jgi:hypothetical protein